MSREHKTVLLYHFLDDIMRFVVELSTNDRNNYLTCVYQIINNNLGADDQIDVKSLLCTNVLNSSSNDHHRILKKIKHKIFRDLENINYTELRKSYNEYKSCC